MKTRSILPLLPLFAFSLQPLSFSRAQGSLTPPAGPPVAGMKTLDQVEARRPVQSVPGSADAMHVITTPGSYYLTGNITAASGKSAILIQSTNVTIDLNGFVLEGVSGATVGIDFQVNSGQFAVRNGHVRFFPAGGIRSTANAGCLLEHLSILSCGGPGVAVGKATIRQVHTKGTAGSGIKVSGGTINECIVETVNDLSGAIGIHAPASMISHCSVTGITGSSTADDSVAGILADGGVVTGCHVSQVTQNGNNKAVGILRAAKVTDSSVTGIRAPTATPGSLINEAIGIRYCSVVEGCSVATITSAYLITGVGDCGVVNGCQVTVGGIVGDTITGNFVNGNVSGSSITGNTVTNGLVGIRGSGGLVSGNTIRGKGIQASVYTVVKDNHLIGDLNNPSLAGIGIDADSLPGVRIEGNHLRGYTTGIRATASTALVIRNAAGGNTTNYNIPAGMPVVPTTALGTNPNANITQ